VVGCGKTGERTARQLVHKLGARDLVLMNRTIEKAEALAGILGGRAAPWDTLHVEAAMADVVIVATASESPVILLADALRRTREACGTAAYSLLLMDLSLPRNIDPAVTSSLRA
jgi:glutamyl-tRNA reductase